MNFLVTNLRCLPFAEENEVVQTLGAQGMAKRVHVRRPDAGSHALHIVRDQQLSEFLGKFGVVVEDQVLRLDRFVAPQDGQISGLLGHPRGVWVFRDSRDDNAA